MIKHLLGSRSAVSVLIFSPSPSPGYYLIERAYNQEARVRNQSGEIVADLKPGDIISDLEVYGQHKISEITRHKGQLAELLGRFVGTDNEAAVSEDGIRERFRTSRKKITDLDEKIAKLDLALAALPGLKEQLKRFEETELATRLQEQASVQHEQRILDDFSNAITGFEKAGDALKPDGETASTVLPPEKEVKLPHRDDLAKGAQALSDEFGFTDSSSQKIAAGGETLALLVEETRIPPEAIIKLNVGRDGGENWKELDRLSAGQKATAVLMLLLLESHAPLIIDQPEDDLDNQFIAGPVVEKMRVAKRQRQFLFSSHNPNIPVLGDADQIIGLTPVVEDGVDRTKIYQELCGSIDKEEVQELIKELLEGGEQAFSTRRRKYGF